MPTGSKRQKELQRKKRLDAKEKRLASRRALKRRDEESGAEPAGPRCSFCEGPLFDPDEPAPGAPLMYGGHPICPTCHESVPPTDEP